MNATDWFTTGVDISLPSWAHENEVVVWGLLPAIAANVGYWPTVLLLEWICALGCAKTIEYIGGYHAGDESFSPRSRGEALRHVRSKIPFWKQAGRSAWNLLGPMVVVNGFISYALLSNTMPPPSPVLTLSWYTLASFALMFLVGDLGLYWGHRIQHQIDWLWRNSHSLHHKIGTPSPASTAYLEGMDLTLQGGIPLIFATLCVRPHPVVFWVYIACRTAENAINHCGLDNLFLDIITLKILPFRAGVDHHDAHHQFSNYGPNAKNFGEAFWIWDWLFGTLSTVSTTMRVGNKKGANFKGNRATLSKSE